MSARRSSSPDESPLFVSSRHATGIPCESESDSDERESDDENSVTDERSGEKNNSEDDEGES